MRHETHLTKTDSWYTPRFVFDALGLEFDLDPCVGDPSVSVVPAKKSYSPPVDGLREPWSGLVWMNPPYGRETARWVDRIVTHGNGVALVMARPDTRWFQRATEGCMSVCFVSKRINFWSPVQRQNGGPGCGSAIFAFGEVADQAVRRCGLGAVLTHALG